MAEYLLAVHYVEGSETPSDVAMQQSFENVDKFNQKLQADGVWVFAGGLTTPDTATVVDGTGAEVIITDGPFPEAKEQLGGFWIVDVPDLDAAMKLAAEGSAACSQPVEVRPFQAEPPA